MSTSTFREKLLRIALNGKRTCRCVETMKSVCIIIMVIPDTGVTRLLNASDNGTKV